MTMNKKTRESLLRALSYCSLRELPEVDKGEDFWIKALALVAKSDGNDYFVNVEKDIKTLSNRVTKDFGATGVIVKYKEIYPYLYLSSDYMPTFPDRTKAARVEYLKKMYPFEKFDGLSLKELNDKVLSTAITLQLNSIKSNNFYSDIEYDRQEYTEAEAGGDEGEVESKL